MNIARRHPIATFLVAMYALAALIYLPPMLGTAGLGIVRAEIPLAPFLLLSTIALAAVAFAVTAAADGREGVRELGRRALRFRVSPVWYVLALLLLPLAALVVAVVTNGAAAVTAVARNPNLVVGWLVTVVSSAIIINFWEELGWTGFVLHRLQPRFGPLVATVLTTWAQAAIHLPLLFIVGGVSDVRLSPAQYPIYLVVLFLAPLGNRTVLTWLYNRSGHSLPVAGITHATWNLAASSAFLPALVPGLDSVWAFAGYAAVAVVLIVVTRGRLGYDAAERDVRRESTGELATA